MIAQYLYVGLGAVLGAWARWGLGSILNMVTPYVVLGTLIANIIASFLIGCAIGCMDSLFPFPDGVKLFFLTGFLGSLSTFSTFSAEVVSYFYKNEIFLGICNILSHVGGGLIATVLGIMLMRGVSKLI